MHILSYGALKAHQQEHRPSDLNTAGDQADAHGFPGGFVVNLYTALEVLAEMGSRLFTQFLGVPARLMCYEMQRPHTAPVGLEGRSRFSTTQEKTS